MKEILETQKQQLTVLGELLEESKSGNKKYRDYLVEQQKTNDDYKKSLDESAEQAARGDTEREEQHEEYIRGAVLARITNYIRMVASICLVGLIGYIVLFGLKLN